MDDKSIKKEIRKIRERLGYTQEEFAQELDIDSSTYWRLEEGKTHILPPVLYKIATYAHMDIETLITGKEFDRELAEAEDYRERLDTQREFYEDLIKTKDETISNLNNYIKTLQK